MLLAGAPNVDKVFDPEVVTGSHFSTRLVWQLAAVFGGSAKCELSAEEWDQVTLDYAAEVEASASSSGGSALPMAIWILLHLHSAETRERAVKDLLERNAETVANGTPEMDADATLALLTQDLQIPAALIYRVRALYAASNGDAAQQTMSLLLAGDMEDAHSVLCASVGPTAVIEQDYGALSTLLGQFEKLPQRPETWLRGGQVYADFVKLVAARGKGKDVGSLVGRLRKGLGRMGDVSGAGRSLEQRISVREIGRVVQEAEDAEREGGGGNAAGVGAGKGWGEGGKMLDAYWRAMGVVA